MGDEKRPEKEDEEKPPSPVAIATPSSAVLQETSREYPNIVLFGIEHPGKNDVMFGRGGDTNYHIGNHRFRMVVDEYRQRYRSVSRKEKAVVVQEVVDHWRTKDPPGRFLTRTEPAQGDGSLWHDVGDDVARKKAAKILSEKSVEEKATADDNRKRPAADISSMPQPRIREQRARTGMTMQSTVQIQRAYQESVQRLQAQQHMAQGRAQASVPHSGQILPRNMFAAGQYPGGAMGYQALHGNDQRLNLTSPEQPIPAYLQPQEQLQSMQLQHYQPGNISRQQQQSMQRQQYTPPPHEDTSRRHAQQQNVGGEQQQNVSHRRSAASQPQGEEGPMNRSSSDETNNPDNLPSAASLTAVFNGSSSSDIPTNGSHSTEEGSK